ncbi:MAG TPA: sigma-70 family RNA polymerase sigma factor [Leptospiraceae bacterium]|nr:sigma-70 family RNA polymerase sigma factor [Leptospiraceae bacterium]HRG73487.1 sigma-70 family RNA polymerase sigma factor [Leptospiraceae bacterium]
MLCNPADWSCIQSVLAGDFSAFEFLMDKYQGMIFSQAIKYTGNQEEAEDLTQEIFLKAFEALSTFKGESQFSTWVYSIARNKILMKHRKESTNPQISADDVEEVHNKYFDKIKKWREQITPEMQILKQEMNTKIASLLSRLPSNYKNPLMLYYFENMSYKEISEKLDIKVNTLKSYIFRGKELMKDWLQKDND